MLSVFPELFTYALVAPFVLRVALGTFFVLQGMRRRREDNQSWDALWGGQKIGGLGSDVLISSILIKIQIVIGVLLFVGLYTQVAAILAIAFVGVEFFKRHSAAARGLTASPSFAETWLASLIIAIAVSLLFLGAGLIAFDLPL